MVGKVWHCMADSPVPYGTGEYQLDKLRALKYLAKSNPVFWLKLCGVD